MTDTGAGAADEVVLYDYWRSSAAYRLRIALNLLGITYRQVPVDLTRGEHRTAAHLARNPQGLVPALWIDGQMLTQSVAILEYLDETRGAGFLPANPLERVRVRRIAHAIAMEIHPVCNLSVARFGSENSGGTLTMKDWMHAFIPDRLQAVDRMLDAPETGLFCHGDSITMADICLAPQVYNARRWEVDLTPMPHIRRVMERLDSHPAFMRAHPDANRPGQGGAG